MRRETGAELPVGLMEPVVQGGAGMAANGKIRTRRNRVAYRPCLDAPLEARALLSSGGLNANEGMLEWLRNAAGQGRGPAAEVSRVSPTRNRVQPNTVQPKFVASPQMRFLHMPSIHTQAGGKAVRIQDGRGGAFEARITIGPGTVQAQMLRDGTVDLIVRGTNSNSDLVIGPIRPVPEFGTSHTFDPVFGIGQEVLEVHNIEVRTGQIRQILGYRTVNLSGAIRMDNDAAVERIALNSMQPGAQILVTGDLDTLDVFTDVTLIGEGSGIFVGRDLNWADIQGNLTVTDGAQFVVGRDIGLFAQPAKGTGGGGQGMEVRGNLLIGIDSAFTVERNLASPLVIFGNLGGASRLNVNQPAQVIVFGSIT